MVLTSMICDNKTTIFLLSHAILHEKTKHVEKDIHFIHEKIVPGIITTSHVRSGDVLTRPFNFSGHQLSIGKLGFVDIFTPF